MVVRDAGSMCGMTTPHTENPVETAAVVWLEENWEAIPASNAWVEANGLTLRKFRLF